ncbi:MAG: hypothetical protein KGI25_03815 [Thaumarchaeota archaeon]|nr:hypothetical protein [Nitrososphaerota archaeon]
MYSIACKIIFFSVTILLISGLSIFLQNAWATNYLIQDQTSCTGLEGSWNPNFSTCAIKGLILSSRDKLAVNSTVHLENIGIITNNGGKIYIYGNLTTDEFSVIYNNAGGSIYNYGTLTASSGTINNYAPIYNHGIINNYGTIYNYNIINNYNGSTIDDRYGVIHNNGTINNDCKTVFMGLVPYGNVIKNACSTMPQSGPILPPVPLALPSVQSPLNQTKSGVPVKNVVCGQGLELVIKNEDGSPACVTPETAQKLVERHWAQPITPKP